MFRRLSVLAIGVIVGWAAVANQALARQTSEVASRDKTGTTVSLMARSGVPGLDLSGFFGQHENSAEITRMIANKRRAQISPFNPRPSA